jgi:hypothetical protein
MPKVKFLKPWRHFKAGDTLNMGDEQYAALADKGVIKKMKVKAKAETKPGAKPKKK